jgi:hypothetical protein
MPKRNDAIVALKIKVSLAGFASFDIDAGDKPETYPFGRTGGSSLRDQDLLKDVLRQVIASYPDQPISLCIDSKNRIVDYQQCPPVPNSEPPDGKSFESEAAPTAAGGPRRSGVKAAAAKKAVAKKSALKTTPHKRAGAKPRGR